MLLVISLIAVFYGLIINEPEPIAIGGIIYFFSYPIQQYRKGGITSLSPVSLYSLIKGVVSVGNYIGLISYSDPEARSIYFKYASEDHIIPALLLHYIGSAITIYGFEKAFQNKFRLPKIYYSLTKSQLSYGFPLLVVVTTTLSFLNFLPSFGTITTLLKFLPIASVFFFARYGAHTKQRKFITFAFILMLATTLQAILFAYLRMNMVLPGTAFVLGILFGYKSFHALKSPILYPMYVGAFIFISYFTFLGSTRSQLGSGMKRIEKVQVLSEELEDAEEETTFLSRFSNMNQLSQIGKVAEEDGFYYGETLSYMVFGFIPRFIWPEKPLIQQGAWFALRIGKGRLVDGKYTNSIDMTPMGEFYLNFGWIGVIIGGYILGRFFGLMWLTTDFWKSETNILGSLFGFYLLFLGLFSFGADLQVVITLTAVYLIFWGLNKLLGHPKTVNKLL